jgi:hypothetical protein
MEKCLRYESELTERPLNHASPFTVPGRHREPASKPNNFTVATQHMIEILTDRAAANNA